MIEFVGKAEDGTAPYLHWLVCVTAVVLFLLLALLQQDTGTLRTNSASANQIVESGSPDLPPIAISAVAEGSRPSSAHEPAQSCINTSGYVPDAQSAVCIAESDDSLFLIVADSRAAVKLHSLRTNAMQIINAIAHRDDKPAGLNFDAAHEVAEVLMVEGAPPEETSYQLLYRNARGDIVMLAELAAVGVDGQGYEKLAFDSLLAFSGAIDATVSGVLQVQDASAHDFPYPQYPPVSYESVLTKLGQTRQYVADSESVNKLSVLSDSSGNALWGRSLGYELAVIGAQGQVEPVWVDAFLGIEYSRQELDTAAANVEQRKALLQSMGDAQRTRLSESGQLADFLLQKVPLSRKEAERRAAKRAHDANFGTSLAGI